MSGKSVLDKHKLKPVDDTSPDWRAKALCRRIGSLDTTRDWVDYTRRFKGGSRAKVEHEERLRSICMACPVIDECRVHALTVDHGFMAGETEQERAHKRAVEQRRKWEPMPELEPEPKPRPKWGLE